LIETFPSIVSLLLFIYQFPSIIKEENKEIYLFFLFKNNSTQLDMIFSSNCFEERLRLRLFDDFISEGVYIEKKKLL